MRYIKPQLQGSSPVSSSTSSSTNSPAVSMTMNTSVNPEASASSTYKKLTQLEHILLRADTYVGSKEPETVTAFVPVEKPGAEGVHMIQRDITFVPAFYKIFDEILVNAADNKVRDPEHTDAIKVTIDVEQGESSVWNNGKGVPVQVHDKEGIYIPEMIFGHLLTGSNFDDNDRKVVGGRNGYGAKLTNMASVCSGSRTLLSAALTKISSKIL